MIRLLFTVKTLGRTGLGHVGLGHMWQEGAASILSEFHFGNTHLECLQDTQVAM